MNIIVDSSMTLDEALDGKAIPDGIRKTLTLIDVEHLSFDQKIHRGQLVVHNDISSELHEIFIKLLAIKFPIEKVLPVVVYDWSDDQSMADNNTSAFNYRIIHGTNQLSKHALGLAIDINPIQNPYTRRDSKIMPPGAKYNPSNPGTLIAGDNITKLFLDRDWDWGGNWDRKDWQHFQKNPHEKI